MHIREFGESNWIVSKVNLYTGECEPETWKWEPVYNEKYLTYKIKSHSWKNQHKFLQL